MTSTLVPPAVISSTLGASQGLGGPPGPVGPAGGAGAAYVAAAALSGHRAVVLDSVGQVFYASSDTLSHALRVAGLTLNAAALGDSVTVQSEGLVEFAGWSWVPEQPVFVGLGGALVQAVPNGAAFAQVIALALSATRLAVGLQPPIVIT